MTLSADELSAISARASKATPGPWHRHTYGHRDTRSQVRTIGKSLRAFEAEHGFPSTDLSWVHQDPEGPAIALVGNGARQVENADFIAHAREDIDKLLAALVAAEADVERLGDGLVQWMEAAKAEEARAKALEEALRDIVAWYGDDGPNDSQRVLHDRLEAARAALITYREAAP